MKLFNKTWGLVAIITLLTFIGCDKMDIPATHSEGIASVLSSSSTNVAPPPADSNKTVLTLNWTSPDYATDSSNYKFVIEIDSTGKNFAKADTRTVVGKLNSSFTAKELNTLLLARGYAFNVPVDMDVRIKSSYGNNNELKISNVLKIRMTPYKIPPKVILPTSGRLFIVGDASTFGWSNDAAPPFPPDREFARLDETTWAGIFNLTGSGVYKILQTQGNWNTQYHMKTGGTANGGSFEYGDANPGFPSPAAGWYKIVLDFQEGKFTVTSVSNPLPQALYTTGDATAAGWTNAPPANQKFSRLNSSVYEITMTLNPGKFYKFLSSSGNWQPQFGGNSATGGALGANYGGGSDPPAIPTPTVAGDYKVQVNFATSSYTVTKI